MKSITRLLYLSTILSLPIGTASFAMDEEFGHETLHKAYMQLPSGKLSGDDRSKYEAFLGTLAEYCKENKVGVHKTLISELAREAGINSKTGRKKKRPSSRAKRVMSLRDSLVGYSGKFGQTVSVKWLLTQPEPADKAEVQEATAGKTPPVQRAIILSAPPEIDSQKIVSLGFKGEGGVDEEKSPSHSSAPKLAVDGEADKQKSLASASADIDLDEGGSAQAPKFVLGFADALPEGVNSYDNMGWSGTKIDEETDIRYRTVGEKAGAHSPIALPVPAGGFSEGDKLTISHRGPEGTQVRLLIPGAGYSTLGELNASVDFTDTVFNVPADIAAEALTYVSFILNPGVELGQDIAGFSFSE